MFTRAHDKELELSFAERGPNLADFHSQWQRLYTETAQPP
jgi:hypothetical protein